MAFDKFVLLFTFNLLCSWAASEIVAVFDENNKPMNLENEAYFITDKLSYDGEDKVDIKVYYEVYCEGCRSFDSEKLVEGIQKFGDSLNIQTFPYGNAKTIITNGKIEFKCQHGQGECYGNKLHACALDIIANRTEALLYNSCMMSKDRMNRGSDDDAADKCAHMMNLESNPIKECANGDRGTQLLKHYGEESKKAHYDYVPYVLVNGKVSDYDVFIKDICNTFKNPPPVCK